MDNLGNDVFDLGDRLDLGIKKGRQTSTLVSKIHLQTLCL